MYGDTDSDKNQVLRQMMQEALAKTNANRVAARDVVIGMTKLDRRFDHLDHERLVDKAFECSQYGRKFDWSDPELRPGGQPRPQLRRGSGW